MQGGTDLISHDPRGPKRTKFNPDDLKIVKIPVADPEYESEIPEHMKTGYFPGFPSTTLVCGPPGRGKTNLLMNLLLNPKMWNMFFDVIYAYGPTVRSDKLYKTIKLQPDNICDDAKKIIPDLEKKLAQQTKLVEANPATAPKVLFLFEDMTSFFNTVQQKPEFHRCYTQCRHVKGASITMVHKYHAFNRTPRTSSQHIIIFETNAKDVKHLYDEFGPRSLTLPEFNKMVGFALKPTKENPKPFFYVNTTQPEKTRYRKCFSHILELDEDRDPFGPKKSLSTRRRPQKRERRGRSQSPEDYRKTSGSYRDRR